MLPDLHGLFQLLLFMVYRIMPRNPTSTAVQSVPIMMGSMSPVSSCSLQLALVALPLRVIDLSVNAHVRTYGVHHCKENMRTGAKLFVGSKKSCQAASASLVRRQTNINSCNIFIICC